MKDKHSPVIVFVISARLFEHLLPTRDKKTRWERKRRVRFDKIQTSIPKRAVYQVYHYLRKSDLPQIMKVELFIFQIQFSLHFLSFLMFSLD